MRHEGADGVDMRPRLHQRSVKYRFRAGRHRGNNVGLRRNPGRDERRAELRSRLCGALDKVREPFLTSAPPPTARPPARRRRKERPPQKNGASHVKRRRAIPSEISCVRQTYLLLFFILFFVAGTRESPRRIRRAGTADAALQPPLPPPERSFASKESVAEQ